MPIDMNVLLTPEQVSQALAVSANTVRRWCRDGRLTERGIEIVQLPGGRWLIHQDVINKPSPK